MKSRTKLEKLVTELSGKLPAITKEQEDWAKEHLFDLLPTKVAIIGEIWKSRAKLLRNRLFEKTASVTG